MAAAWVAQCRAALALAFALAAAPLRRRRPPPGAGAVAGEGGVEPGEERAGGSSSTSSFAFIFPSRIVKVKEAKPPACSEMQKAADPADISVLFFSSWCYFLGYAREKNVLAPVLSALVSTDSVRTISIRSSAMDTF